jgi:uncharacterized protein
MRRRLRRLRHLPGADVVSELSQNTTAIFVGSSVHSRLGPFNLQLIITEQCNLRCRYCFGIDKSPRVMPVSLAKNLLDRELSRPDGPDEYQIDLGGAEPFLSFPLVREIVEYAIANSERWGKRFHFFICSNLTLLDNEIKTWLEGRRGWVVLGTSLDGTKRVHDHYRSGSYDAVVRELPFYRSVYPSQGVKMTIGPDTIDEVYEGILHIESLGLRIAANVVYEPVWGDAANKRRCLRIWAEQLEMLVQHYSAQPDQTVPMLVALPIRLLVRGLDPEHHWCGSGRSMRAYDTDGRELPCHRFSRFCTGKEYRSTEPLGQRTETRCDGCDLAPACPHCPGFNWQTNGHPSSRTYYHCEFVKLQMLATARLIYLRRRMSIALLADHGKHEIGDRLDARTLLDLKAVDYVVRRVDVEKVIQSV